MKPAWVVAAWAASTVGAFWWYDGRYRLPVAPKPPTQPSVASSLAVPGAKATLLAFYASNCACSRFALDHVRRLQRDYAGQGLRVVLVLEDGDAPEGFVVRPDPGGALAKALGVPAAPGAVVLDAAGKTRYTGGFNVARFCDDARTAFAEQAAQAVLAGRSPGRPNGDFYGCRTSG